MGKQGLTRTNKPRCHACGKIMVTIYYKQSAWEAKGSDDHRTYIALTGRWYCKHCGRIVKEE